MAWAGGKAGCTHGLAGVSLLPEGQLLFGLILCFLSGELTAGAGPKGVPVPERSVKRESNRGRVRESIPCHPGWAVMAKPAIKVGFFCATPHPGAQRRLGGAGV